MGESCLLKSVKFLFLVSLTHPVPAQFGTGTKVMSLVCVGRVPLDPRLTQSLEEGRSFVDAFVGTPTQIAMKTVLQKLLQGNSSDDSTRTDDSKENKT